MKKAQHFILGAVPEHLHGKIRLAEKAGDSCVHQVAAPVAGGQQLFADTVPPLKQEDPAAAPYQVMPFMAMDEAFGRTMEDGR